MSAGAVAVDGPAVGVSNGDGDDGDVVVGVRLGVCVLAGDDEVSRGVGRGVGVALWVARGVLLATGVGVGLDGTGAARGGRTYR